MESPGGLPELSNCYCHPGRAGGLPICNYRLSEGLILPIGPVQDTTGDPALGDPTFSRDLFYAYVQDEWTLHPDWTLTWGARYDHYSDVGATVNPRLALVWNARHDLTAKLLYGRGFRAPSRLETQARQIPALWGNPDLHPEQVEAMRGRLSRSDANRLSVMTELQADCFAGVWANHAGQGRQFLEAGDIEEGIRAAGAIGDDRLQRQSQGFVVPDAFTHGSSQQRVAWFKKGLARGTIEACDTFNDETL